jgi:hypothetical protein
VLHLIKMWLDCPVEETDDRGRKTRTTEARDKRRGIPQGSPISPLLANLYMRRFVLGWKMFGLERSLGTRLVTYADDLVILCRQGKAEEALQRLREDRASSYRLPAVKEEHQARGRESPRADRPIGDMARNHNAGGQVEPHAAWMGELLSGRRRQ